MRPSYIPFTRTLSAGFAVSFLALSGALRRFPAAFRRFAGGFPVAFLENTTKGVL